MPTAPFGSSSCRAARPHPPSLTLVAWLAKAFCGRNCESWLYFRDSTTWSTAPLLVAEPAALAATTV
jgi:hypothetical protein